MESLNQLTKAVTGGTWERLAEQMNGGYIPTLMELPGNSKRQKERNRLTKELADRIESLGWKVWRGSK